MGELSEGGPPVDEIEVNTEGKSLVEPELTKDGVLDVCQKAASFITIPNLEPTRLYDKDKISACLQLCHQQVSKENQGSYYDEDGTFHFPLPKEQSLQENLGIKKGESDIKGLTVKDDVVSGKASIEDTYTCLQNILRFGKISKENEKEIKQTLETLTSHTLVAVNGEKMTYDDYQEKKETGQISDNSEISFSLLAKKEPSPDQRIVPPETEFKEGERGEFIEAVKEIDQSVLETAEGLVRSAVRERDEEKKQALFKQATGLLTGYEILAISDEDLPSVVRAKTALKLLALKQADPDKATEIKTSNDVLESNPRKWIADFINIQIINTGGQELTDAERDLIIDGVSGFDPMKFIGKSGEDMKSAYEEIQAKADIGESGGKHIYTLIGKIANPRTLNSINQAFFGNFDGEKASENVNRKLLEVFENNGLNLLESGWDSLRNIPNKLKEFKNSPMKDKLLLLLFLSQLGELGISQVAKAMSEDNQ